MKRLHLLALALLVSACARDQTGPELSAGPPSLAIQPEPRGPPAAHPFGPDSYQTGLFTGQGSTAPGLSCGPSPGGGLDCSGFLASRVDGARLDVSVRVPAGGGAHALVVLLQGWGGSKNGLGDIARRLLAADYAVMRYSARGFGDSWGQVDLADVHAEVEDLRSLVGQVVDQPELAPALNPEAVAVMGVSYGGGQTWLAALNPTFPSPAGKVVRIRTVVPIVPWSDLLYSLIPNGRPRNSLDVPGSPKLSYVNGLYASGLRRSPARPYPNFPPFFMAWHLWINAAEPSRSDPLYRRIGDGLAGYRSIWWQQGFWQVVAARRTPVFQVQGFTDDLFPLPEAKRMLLALQTLDPQYPIASYFGDLGHPRASNKPGETDYVLGLIQQWLDFYLKGVGAEPPHRVYAAITRPRDEPFDRANVITVASYDELATGKVSRELDGVAVLTNPSTDPQGGFVWDPLVMEAARELKPYNLPPPPSAVVETSLAVYQVPVAALTGGGALLIAGQPTVTLQATTPAPRVQLAVRLFDVARDGRRELVTRGTYTLQRVSLGDPRAGVPVTIPTYGNLWRAPADHVLRLEVSNLDSPYIAPSRVPSVTHISHVRLEVPFR